MAESSDKSVPSFLPATPEAAREVGLIKWPDPRLRKRAMPIDTFDGKTVEVLKALTDRMFEIMREEEGIGLAGPQVGVSARLFVMDGGDKLGGPMVVINPVLSDPDGEDEAEEGCLSLPDIRTPVIRPTRLRLQARDLDGNPIDLIRDDFATRVWQHETDHLNGVLLLDKMPESVRMSVRKQLRELEAEYAEANPKPEENAKPQRKQRAAKKKRK